MWKLSKEENNKRLYINDETGSRTSQTLCYVDKENNKWWMFDDLLTLPYTRNFAATKVTLLFSLGISKDDLMAHINGLKAILKSSDAEKYEKSFALVLDFETKVLNATSALKQMTALVCVYFTMNDELIDSFENEMQLRKMALIEADPEMHAFFLREQIKVTDDYMMRLNLLSQIVSPTSNGKE